MLEKEDAGVIAEEESDDSDIIAELGNMGGQDEPEADLDKDADIDDIVGDDSEK